MNFGEREGFCIVMMDKEFFVQRGPGGYVILDVDNVPHMVCPFCGPDGEAEVPLWGHFIRTHLDFADDVEVGYGRCEIREIGEW